jgi:hypothetical protein
LLVVLGLDVLFSRRRLRIARFMVSLRLIGIVVTVALVLVIIWLAYGNQAEEFRDENQQAFAESIPEGIASIRVVAEVLNTEVTIRPAEGDDPRWLAATFTGSRESDITMAWTIEGETGVLTLTEEAAHRIPKLEDYGRGRLDLVLPTKVTIEAFSLTSEWGDVAFDMQPLPIQRVTLAVDEGDLTLDLPENEVLTGQAATGQGDIILSVPPDVALTVSLDSGSGDPDYEYDSFRYDLLRNGTLKLKNTEAFQVGLTVSVDDGSSLVVIDREA